MTEKEEVKVKCPLRRAIIAVKPIVDESSFLYQNTGRTALPGSRKGARGVPIDPETKRYVEPLTPEEIAWFESEECSARFPKGWLVANSHNKKSYWTTYDVALKANETTNLDLSTVEGYLKYAFLKAQRDQIAPSWEERFGELSYTHAFVDLSKASEDNANRIDRNKEAYKWLGVLETSIPKMRGVISQYYHNTNSNKKIPATTSREWLVSELGDIIDRDISNFLAIKHDKDIDSKIFINQALEANVIFKEDKNKYRIPGLDDLYTMAELVEFLGDLSNQKVYGKLKAQIEST